jgi:hypothetical protein
LAGLLVGPEFLRRYGERIAALARETGAPLEPIALPADPAARLAPDQVLRVELAYFSGDIHPAHSGAFFSAAFSAEKLRWVHCFNAGTDHPIFARPGRARDPSHQLSRCERGSDRAQRDRGAARPRAAACRCSPPRSASAIGSRRARSSRRPISPDRRS